MNIRIKKVREAEKLTQTAFGERLGLSQNYVWMLETGQRVPSDRTIRDICREFGYREEWLRTGKGEPKPARSRSKVVFPQPEGPRMVRNSPFFTLRLTSLRMHLSPKLLEMFLNSMICSFIFYQLSFVNMFLIVWVTFILQKRPMLTKWPTV